MRDFIFITLFILAMPIMLIGWIISFIRWGYKIGEGAFIDVAEWSM